MLTAKRTPSVQHLALGFTFSWITLPQRQSRSRGARAFSKRENQVVLPLKTFELWAPCKAR
jgi:hypothetical protein